MIGQQTNRIENCQFSDALCFLPARLLNSYDSEIDDPDPLLVISK